MRELKGLAFGRVSWWSSNAVLSPSCCMTGPHFSRSLASSCDWGHHPVIDLSQKEWAGSTMCQLLGLTLQTLIFFSRFH